jgi:hypothetical protein
MSAIGNEPTGGELEQAAGAAGAGAAEQGAGASAPETPDVAALIGDFNGRIEAFGQQLASLAERIPEPSAPQDEEEDEQPTLQFSDEDFNDDGSLTLEAQTREIERIAARVVEDTLRPQREAEQQARRDAGFDSLEERYPDLADEQQQDYYLQKVQEYVGSIIRATGRPELAAMAMEPETLETVYLAEQARKRAGDEVPAGADSGVTLDRGGTAPPPAPSKPEPDDGDRIVALASKSRFRLGT